MRTTAFLFATATCLVTHAQTYYYINSISVDPPSPATTDAVTITLHGDLSNTASVILSASHELVGNTVEITVVAGNQGIGLDVLVPHEESFALGTLPAGVYMIAVNGGFIWDMAPSPQHQFVVSGGGATDCDSLEFSITWAAFNSDYLVVTAENHSSDLFDLPGFVLLDAQGDTLARETVSYFGIGTGPQAHLLEILDPAGLVNSPVQGTLQLWSGYYTELECEWEGPWELCLPAPCAPVQPYLMNVGGALVDVSIPYTIIDNDGLIVASGTLVLEDPIQNDLDTACLPPGQYTLIMTAVAPVGGQLIYGLGVGPGYAQDIQASYTQGLGQTNNTSFTFYEPCIPIIDAMNDTTPSANFTLRQDGDDLILDMQGDGILGTVDLLDVQGKLLLRTRITAPTGRIPLAGFSCSAYVVHRHGSKAARVVR